MSKANTAPNDTKSAKAYVDWLISLGVVDEVWIQGSRSPLRSKKVHKNSDWDLFVLLNENCTFVQPRVNNQLHADVSMSMNTKVKHPKAVMIYPKDEYGVLDIKKKRRRKKQ